MRSAPLDTAAALPFGERAADEAAEWLTLLMSGEATEDDRRRWQQWRRGHPDHERAWQHIESFSARLKGLHPAAAHAALASGRAPAPRRKALRALLWLGAAGATGVLASRTQTWQQTVADFRTGTGEQRDLSLPDGTRLTLGTASAIDVRFDDRRRLVRLVAGEVLIVTGHDRPDSPPFVVDTAQGRIRALGTRFSVRQDEGRSRVAVLESAVEIAPADAAAVPVRLRAGERASFGRDEVGPIAAVDAQTTAWTLGQLIADDMRLDDFLAELGRYRPGIVRCDPAVAGLRLSGVFPLADTERILAMLPSVLPVQVRLRTRFWATVEAVH